MRKRTVFIVVLAVLLMIGFIAPRASLASNYVYHRVQYGETLGSIAHKYGVTVWAIAQANGIYNLNLIYAGQVLLIPLSAAPAATSACVEVHVVRAGENLTVIAARYRVSVHAIVQANNLKNANLIYVNQRLRIPCTPAKPASPTPTPTPPAYPNWKGQYWNNALLSGAPTFVRNDTKVDFSWGVGGPGSGVGPDNFSVRWTSSQAFSTSDTYRFYARADDGVRVWVDGTLIIDEWHLASGQTYAAERAMTAGTHSIQVDFYELTGTAFVKVWWERLGPDIPTDAWLAQYYGTRWFEGGPEISRLEPAIAYDWGAGPPLPGFRQDDFAVRWQRDWTLGAGHYRLDVRADDGVKIWVDDALILNEWQDTGGGTYSQDLYLAKGSHRFKVEYYEATNNALIFVDLVPFTQVYNWSAEFFNNMGLQGSPVVTRQDTAVDFTWGRNSPAAGVTADYFSARWTGNFPFEAGVYRFSARADDGVKVYVNNVLLINEWHLSTGRTYWTDITLGAGTQAIKVEFYENEVDALVHVWWEKR